MLAAGQDYVFASLEGTPINTIGWNMQGAAKVSNTPGFPANSEIVLTEAILTQSGAIFYNTPINLSQCKKWIAEFEFRIFDGTAADGIAFCYLDVPPSGFVTGGGIGIPATANGLKVVLDTWRNCGTDQIPKVQIRWGAGYDECNGQPTRANNDGAISFIRSPSFNKCRIEYNEGNIRVLLNGTEYLTAFQTFTFTGYFGFTASTGGSTDKHSIKNVKIFTEMPASLAGVDREVCPNVVASLGTPANPGLVYRWTPTNGLSDPNSPNPTVSLANDGEQNLKQQYIVETAYADRPGCASKDSVLVTIIAKPRPEFSHDTLCLPGGNVRFTNLSRNQGQVDLNQTWLWNFGDPASGPSNISDQASPSHFYNRATQFTVSLTATNSKGCTQTITKEILPVVSVPQASFTISGDSCSGYNIQFNSVVQQNPVLPLTFAWIFGDGATSSQSSPAHVYQSGGNYLSGLVVSNPYCASQTVNRTIQIRPSPALSLAPDLPTPCKDSPPFALNLVSVTNGQQGAGFYAGAAVTANRFLPVLAIAGPNNIRYTFRAINDCESSLDFSIRVIALPTANAGPDKVSLEATPVQLDGRAEPAGQVTYKWIPVTYMTNPASLSPVVNPPENAWYVIQVTGEGNCMAEDSVFVSVLPSLFIPNAFSPNGDGINDVWAIRHLDEYPGSIVQVFDRYGKRVFYSTGYAQPWDGTTGGRPIPAGVYYYTIDPKNGASRRQGSLTVIR